MNGCQVLLGALPTNYELGSYLTASYLHKNNGLEDHPPVFINILNFGIYKYHDQLFYKRYISPKLNIINPPSKYHQSDIIGPTVAAEFHSRFRKNCLDSLVSNQGYDLLPFSASVRIIQFSTLKRFAFLIWFYSLPWQPSARVSGSVVPLPATFDANGCWSPGHKRECRFSV